MKERFNKIVSLTKHRYVNKYTITLFVFFIWLAFLDSNSLWNRYITNRQQNTIDREIAKYKKNIDNNQALIEALGSNTEELERYAREQYKMKRPNEDIFIIKE